MNSITTLHLPELLAAMAARGEICSPTAATEAEDYEHAVRLWAQYDDGDCPAVFCIWPRREWMWLSGDPAACGLCALYRDRGSPLPCVDHDDDGGCDGYSCTEGGEA